MNVADLLTTPPATTDGQPTGVGDWRFVVELALPHDADSTWGVATWGSPTTWGGLQWSDITDKVRGVEWYRGSDEPYGRPRIGELIATIDARTSLSPITNESAYYAPGTLIRVSIIHPTRTQEWSPGTSFTWVPQFTGTIDSWPLETFGQNADQQVEVRAYETLRFLSEIDEVALASVVGFDDWPDERIDRLLEAADWPYGEVQVDHTRLADAANIAGRFYALQSTDMAINRLAECYLVADGCIGEFRSGRDGRPVLVSPWFLGDGAAADSAVWPLVVIGYDAPLNPSWLVPEIGFDPEGFLATSPTGSVRYVAYDVDSLRISNEDAYIVNSTAIARVGGNTEQSTQSASIARFGRRSFSRFDLACRFDSNASFVAWQYAARRANSTLRVDEVTISTSDRGESSFEHVTFADIGVRTFTYAQQFGAGRPRHVGSLRSMLHRVTPRGSGGVTWSTTFAMDTYFAENLPAAQLPRDPWVNPYA